MFLHLQNKTPVATIVDFSSSYHFKHPPRPVSAPDSCAVFFIEYCTQLDSTRRQQIPPILVRIGRESRFRELCLVSCASISEHWPNCVTSNFMHLFFTSASKTTAEKRTANNTYIVLSHISLSSRSNTCMPLRPFHRRAS